MHADDKRTRLVAFVVITVVFIVSVAALLYWAINVATAHLSSRVTTHFRDYSPLSKVVGVKTMLPNKTLNMSSNYVMACQVF